uniref:Uncharacterized protein n=1 Tax=viral metagenome TaxID=1070528 RepID=A0A6M3JSH7_9ZZZZ
MEIIEIKKKALVLDKDEIEKLNKVLLWFSNRKINKMKDDMDKFAEYMKIKLEEMEA